MCRTYAIYRQACSLSNLVKLLRLFTFDKLHFSENWHACISGKFYNKTHWSGKFYNDGFFFDSFIHRIQIIGHGFGLISLQIRSFCCPINRCVYILIEVVTHRKILVPFSVYLKFYIFNVMSSSERLS